MEWKIKVLAAMLESIGRFGILDVKGFRRNKICTEKLHYLTTFNDSSLLEKRLL